MRPTPDVQTKALSFCRHKVKSLGGKTRETPSILVVQRKSADWEREEIILGHAVLPDPAAYVLADVDHILEQMENAAMADERYALEGKTTVFECVELETAKSEFALLLQAWAAKWIKATAWTFEEVECIELTGTLGRGVE